MPPTVKREPPMTFLRFVCWEVLGPPIYGSWLCPYCDPLQMSKWASLSVLPPKGSYAIKFRCHNCGRWGDEHDLMRLVYPDCAETRRIMLKELKRRHRRMLYPSLGTLTFAQRGNVAATPKRKPPTPKRNPPTPRKNPPTPKRKPPTPKRNSP